MNISHVLWPEGGVCDAAYVAAYQQLQLITLTHLLTESCLTPIHPSQSLVQAAAALQRQNMEWGLRSLQRQRQPWATCGLKSVFIMLKHQTPKFFC